jgi:aconitate hydratase
MASMDSLQTRRELKVGSKTYVYYSLPAAEEAGLAGISRLPVSMKVLLENLLRNEDGATVAGDDLKAIAAWIENKGSVEHEISFRPARVLMQDFTGVPAVVDLAAMRDAMTKLGANPEKINPLNPVDLVIDHSVMVDYFGTAKAFGENVEREYERNIERYRFLRWGSSAFNNFRVVPPGPPRIPAIVILSPKFQGDLGLPSPRGAGRGGDPADKAYAVALPRSLWSQGRMET